MALMKVTIMVNMKMIRTTKTIMMMIIIIIIIIVIIIIVFISTQDKKYISYVTIFE